MEQEHKPNQQTLNFHQWMKSLSDDEKSRFAINWRMPHSLFNVAYNMKHEYDLKHVDWNYIYNTKDMGTWSHGGLVVVMSFRG